MNLNNQNMKKSILLLTMLLIITFTFAQHSRHRKNDFGNNGRYIGGHGSSHRGGRYHSRIGNGDRYSRRKR